MVLVVLYTELYSYGALCIMAHFFFTTPILGFIILILIRNFSKYTVGIDEELKEAEITKEALWEAYRRSFTPKYVDFPHFYNALMRIEACFTIRYLRYLAMKSRINESEFRNYLYCPVTSIQLMESDKDKVVEIFRGVKERVKNKDISGECKADLTLWEFFKKHFYNWWITEERIYNPNDEDRDTERYNKAKEVYEKVYNYFKEFDKAPRISGDLVVELEDILEENGDIIPVSRDIVMKLVEAWRVFKTEAALA